MLMIISILTSLSLVFCFLKFMFSITMSLFFSHSCSSLSSSFIFFPSWLPSRAAFLPSCWLSPLPCVSTLHTVGVLFPSEQKGGGPQARAGYTSPPRGHISDPQADHARSPWPLGYLGLQLRLHRPESRALEPHNPPLPMTHLWTSDCCHSGLFSLVGVSSPGSHGRNRLGCLSISAS